MSRLYWRLLFLPPALLILSCSSVSKKSDVITDDQQIWAQAYIKAKREKNCQDLSALALETKFILQPVALLRARMVCENTALLPAVDSELATKFPHLRALNEERLLTEAQRSDDAQAIAQAWRAKALSSDRIREKIQYLHTALEFSDKSKNTEASEEIQGRIYALAPRLKPNPQPSEYFRVGNDFIYNRQFENGRQYHRKIFESTERSFEERLQARRAYRKSFKTQQNHTQYVIESEKLVQWLEKIKADSKVLSDSYLGWARALWTLGRVTEAKAVLARAEKKLPGTYPADEREYIRGRMSEEAGDFKQAFEHYEKAQKSGRERSWLKDRVQFSKAWALRKLGRYEEAAAALEVLKNETQDPFDQFRYHFWWARSLVQAGKTEAALAEYKKLRDEDRLGYYGLLAHYELGENLPALAAAEATETTAAPPSPLDKDTAHLIRMLSLTQETEILEAYLNLKTQDLKSAGSQNPALWLAYLKAYAQAGLYLPLFAQLGALDATLKSQLLKENPDLLFPRKFEELIQPAAAKFGVKPELMLAIIRQESAFNPLARSPADAFGLMQILPEVAQNQQAQTGIKIDHHEDLYSPENNIPIGAALLAQLSKKYRNQFVLTVAAYNANERAIENWLRTRLKEDPLEFIEDIPYEETRSYVKLIMRNFIFYSRLNQPRQALAFPAWCLEDLQSFKLSTR